LQEFANSFSGDPVEIQEVVVWLTDNASDWIQQRPSALAVLLDSLICLQARELHGLFVAVLEQATDKDLLRVVGQRSRHITWPSDDLTWRSRAWLAFQRLPKDVLENDRVFSTAATLGLQDSVPFLLEYLRHSDLAYAASSGLHSLTSLHRSVGIPRVSDATREQIAEVAIPTCPECYGITWLLGSLTTLKNKDRVASAIAKQFVSGAELQAPAALRSVRQYLEEGWPVEDLCKAMFHVDPSQTERFVQLAERARR
jgi:hypothetical protein